MTRMEQLREKLAALLAQNCSLSDPRMVAVSEQLDRLVLESMRRGRSRSAHRSSDLRQAK